MVYNNFDIIISREGYMARSSEETNFLQPIFSAFGLIASILSAVAPLFAQSRLSRFFVVEELSLPASVISVILGILLSWFFISINGFIHIPIGIKKDRGHGYEEAWKNINDRNFVPIVLVLCLAIFAGFFYFSQEQGFSYGVAQATLYVVFFALLIAAFSLLFIKTKHAHESKQEISNTGNIVFDTLERNGDVRAGVKILHNTQLDFGSQELTDAGLSSSEGIVKRLIVEIVPQEKMAMRLYMSYDYKKLLAAFPYNPEPEINPAAEEVEKDAKKKPDQP
jgi:hypothetical protein